MGGPRNGVHMARALQDGPRTVETLDFPWFPISQGKSLVFLGCPQGPLCIIWTHRDDPGTTLGYRAGVDMPTVTFVLPDNVFSAFPLNTVSLCGIH